MLVGFALERNVGVGSSAHRQADEPLYDIPQIEAHDEHLQHLRRVDALVLNEVCRDAHPFTAEQQAADVDGVVAAKGQQAVVDDFHLIYNLQFTINNFDGFIVANAKSKPNILFSLKIFVILRHFHAKNETI